MRLHITISVLSAVLIAALAMPAQSGIILIKADGSGDEATIQAGVNAVATADTVQLAPGTYTGLGNRDVDFNGRAITVMSQSGPAVTIVDCQNLGRGFIFDSGEGATSVLSGLTITNGSADQGGAVYAFLSKPTIVGNIFSNNTATTDGGAIFVFGTSGIAITPRIADNIISGNTVVGSPGARRGGGIWVSSTSVIVEGNTISDNTAGDGGGVWITGSSAVTLRDNVITQNTATISGGGVLVSGGNPSVRDNTIDDNDAGSWGGGMYVEGSATIVEGCVISNNSCGLLGGGLYFLSGTPTLRNATVVGNIGNGALIASSSTLAIDKTIIAFHAASAMFCFSGSAVTTTCSNLFGNSSDALCGVDGGQNFSADPLFCDVGDYRVAPDSPCAPSNSLCSELVGALPVCVASDAGTAPVAGRSVLHQNTPNPFNPATTIAYEIGGNGGPVSLKVYGVDGRLIRTLVSERRGPGLSHATWDGRDDAGQRVSSGVYFCRLTAPGFRQVRKLVLLK